MVGGGGWGGAITESASGSLKEEAHSTISLCHWSQFFMPIKSSRSSADNGLGTRRRPWRRHPNEALNRRRVTSTLCRTKS